MVVVGYDDNIETPEGYGAFKIINSYGTDWGNDGFAYMSYDGFVAAVQSGYVFTDLINQEPIDTEKEEIENLVEDGVIFNIEFQGRGKYDVEIVNDRNVKVYEEKEFNRKTRDKHNHLEWTRPRRKTCSRWRVYHKAFRPRI
ncbi:MAG: hypothetical protein ACOX0L_09565 [Natronincolaceae bacterium]